VDLNEQRLQPGDVVEALRYELGRSDIIEEDGHIYYVSKATGKRVSYCLMVDAITERQKVKKEFTD